MCAAILTLGKATVRAQTSLDQVRFESVSTAVFGASAKACKTDDVYIKEGDDFGKVCPGQSKYKLLVSGSNSQFGYGIVIPKTDFAIYLFPLETGAAGKFERADLYKQKLVGQIEWRTANDIPFAVIVRVEFYKNKGAKTFANPKNKVGEFLFVRGLKGFEDLQEDLEAVKTAYNPVEQAHRIADEFYEQKKK